jgi:hypothetical protein
MVWKCGSKDYFQKHILNLSLMTLVLFHTKYSSFLYQKGVWAICLVYSDLVRY